MSLDIKRRYLEHVVIECPMENAPDAIAWIHANGFDIPCGWSGPAKGPRGGKYDLPTYDVTRYHTEGMREIEGP